MPDKMIRCPEGHFYDSAKHNSCPWCALPVDTGAVQRKTRSGGMEPPPLPGAVAVVPYAGASPLAPPVAHVGATVRYGMEEKANADPVVGWLVCVAGPDRGRDYRLHAEKNFIGRAPQMDVVIENDNTVSREKHAIVVFDPKKHVFWVLPGEASGLVYLNGEMVDSPMPAMRDDIIELGMTKLVLVPFCGDRYNWNETHSA